MTTKTPEALAELDTMARGCALLADFCVGPRKAEWLAELAKYDKARAALAELYAESKHVASKLDLETAYGLNVALAAVEVLPK